LKIKLLCVDDNKLVLKLIAACAVNLTWLDMFTASSAKQALELTEQQGSFDVVISDYAMPGMNGIDLLRVLKEQCPDTLRFLQSSCADEMVVNTALQEGVVSHFFPKPAAIAEIVAMLNATHEYFLQVHLKA
jgi:CheY-like chemotaxis protein